MKRVCLYTESHEPSGMGMHMLLLASELRNQYELLFVCPPGNDGDYLLQRASELGIITFALHHEEDFSLLLSQQSIDLIHNHAGIGWEGHYGIYAAHQAGIPCIRTEHLPYLLTDTAQQTAHHELIRIVKRLVCVSAGACNSFLKAGITPDKLATVRNGIVAPKAKNAPATTLAILRNEGIMLRENDPIFLSIGRHTEQKNYKTLLKAIPKVLQVYPSAHWLLVGTGSLWKEIGNTINERQLAANVHLLGKRNIIPSLMLIADALVMPSLFEGLSLTILEAIALKLPVIGANVCGIADVITNGITGRLISPLDAAALAAAMCERVNDSWLYARFAEAAYNDFLQNWTAQRMCTDIQNIYEEVLHEATARIRRNKVSITV